MGHFGKDSHATLCCELCPGDWQDAQYGDDDSEGPEGRGNEDEEEHENRGPYEADTC